MKELGKEKAEAFCPKPLPLHDQQPPQAGEVHLWFIDLLRIGSPMLAGAKALSPRQRRTSRRFYLRLLLGSYLGVPGKDVRVLRSGRGKPVLDPVHHATDLHFSMAASDNFCLMGISSSGLIGVDLEPDGRLTGHPMGLAKRYFSATEANALGQLDESLLDAAFLHTWALKEAVVKAGGQGIANQLCRFTVTTDPLLLPEMIEIEGDEAAAWRLDVFKPDAQHLGAVACRQNELKLSCFSLEPPASA